MDGVRILSSRSHELLQEVPLVCQDIFKIASMAPGALLLEAHREYEVRRTLALTLSLVLQHLISVCIEIQSEGWWVSQGAEGAELARGGSGTVCGSCTIWIWPPDPEVSAAGEASPPQYSATAVAQALFLMLQSNPLLVRRPPSESVFWLTSAQIRLWPPAENYECWTPSEWAAWGCRWPIPSILLSDQLAFPSIPPHRQSLHLHSRFKHLTLPVLIDRSVCSLASSCLPTDVHLTCLPLCLSFLGWCIDSCTH